LSSFININGQLLRSDAPAVPADSRAFRYGYGLFETMFVRDGHIRLAAYHWERLKAGMDAMRIKAPAFFFDELKTSLAQTLRRNQHENLGRARLQVWPSSGGYDDGDDFTAAYCIETFPLSEEILQPNQNGLIAGVAAGIVKSADDFSHIKSCNALPYALAARYAKARQWDDAIILNQHHRIADSTIANFFWVEGEKIFTPPLSEGCVDGVMRRHLLVQLPQWGYEVREQAVAQPMHDDVSGIFLTNAIRGIRRVSMIGTRSYDCGIVADLQQKLLRSF
jgi:branched-chain amino acid aminotransferase